MALLVVATLYYFDVVARIRSAGRAGAHRNQADIPPSH